MITINLTQVSADGTNDNNGFGWKSWQGLPLAQLIELLEAGRKAGANLYYFSHDNSRPNSYIDPVLCLISDDEIPKYPPNPCPPDMDIYLWRVAHSRMTYLEREYMRKRESRAVDLRNAQQRLRELEAEIEETRGNIAGLSKMLSQQED